MAKLCPGDDDTMLHNELILSNATENLLRLTIEYIMENANSNFKQKQ